MRSQILLRRTPSLLTHPSLPHRALISSTRIARYPRKDPSSATTPRLSKRSSSSIPSASSEAAQDAPEEAPNLLAGAAPEPPEAPEDPEKPKRRTRTTTVKDAEASPLPNDLDILWLPQDAPKYETPEDPSSSTATPSALPPPELMHEVLTNLHLTLHPQTQHRAAYATQSGPPIEPSLALYCPIEGGDYVIDATVKELGRQAGAEVVVLDAVHLAAGECGHFSKAASVLQLPNNPLHFSAPPSSPRSSSSQLMEEDEDDDDGGMYRGTSQLTLHVLAPMATRPGRTLVAAPRKAANSMAKLKAFFDDLINVSAPVPEGSTEPTSRPPRIIYIRDFPTLAASSASWYPALLAAVRARRQGPLPRTTSPVHSPTTIVFGITPPLVASAQGQGPSSPHNSQGLLSYLMNRQSVAVSGAPARPSKSEYAEDELADKARERRLKERLRQWERGDPSLLQDIPQLSVESESDAGPSGGSGIMVVGGEPDGLPSIPAALARAFGGRVAASRGSPSEEPKPAKFFRTSVIVPGVRSLLLEKACRVDRRREINELTMRMGVASVGGVLGDMPRRPDELEEGKEPDAAARRMWEAWGRHIEVWSNVRKIADRAVGKTIAASMINGEPSRKASLEPVPVEWDAVYEAWTVHKAARDMRKAWIQQASTRVAFENEEEGAEGVAQEAVDEVVERLKRDPDLDPHEQRLLGCIVDTKSIPTTFNQVHLPERTIDSVRTIVSLPLLHPSAFQHGILKEHAMTGCLLFGPPGTGKTLVVRALAKEAGCRMLAVSPSDVMDMYVGEGEKLVRSVFTLARRLSPCVVFIDEIDALFGARMTARESGGAIAHRGVITEFMQEMDGLKSSKDDNIVVIGATNRPFDLDDAVLRRLPRRLLVDLPGEKEREAILKILLREEPLAPDVDLKALARQTESFSGSDLKHLCVSAALDAVKERVEVPWRPSKENNSSEASAEPSTKPAPSIEGDSAERGVQSPVVVEPAVNVDSTQETNPEDVRAAETPKVEVAPATTSEPVSVTTEPSAPTQHRILHWRNFLTALKEITPSSSESLGSLSDLRKWNEEFGEGRKGKKKQVWGKGRFGFAEAAMGSAPPEEGRVSAMDKKGTRD